jgi:dTMP kinase
LLTCLSASLRPNFSATRCWSGGRFVALRARAVVGTHRRATGSEPFLTNGNSTAFAPLDKVLYLLENPPMPRLPFITFEGSEGCGKSTQVRLLAKRLTDAGVPLLVTREPGGTEIGEKIRHLLQFDPIGEAMMPETEVLLFEASRSQLVRQEILPALDHGKVVISDRFADSTTVYQGVARRLDAEMVGHLNSVAVGRCWPDLTFVLDVDVAVARARMLRRVRPAAVLDRMEQEPLKFYEAVCAAYRELAAREPDRVQLIDGAQSLEAVEREIWETVARRFAHLASLVDRPHGNHLP